MRTFHVGGVAGEDIVSGLPRVEEIFEARVPKGEALISEVNGKIVAIDKSKQQKEITIQPQGTKSKERQKKCVVSENISLLVSKGDLVTAGQQLSSGHIDLKKLFKAAGRDIVARYITKEIQEVYSSQGESIDDKHIEIIIRQMFARKRVIDPGNTRLITNDIVEAGIADNINKKIMKTGRQPAELEELIFGISKVSLSTDSFLSAASFQHTAQILIDASLLGKVDHLRGLKENVILGQLIPAGTNFKEKKK